MKILIVFCVLLFAGCASISVDFETGKVTYYRMGDQQIEGLEVIKEGNSIKVNMKKQSAKGELLQKLLENM